MLYKVQKLSKEKKKINSTKTGFILYVGCCGGTCGCFQKQNKREMDYRISLPVEKGQLGSGH